jgi:hypothetical protein
MLFLLSVVPHTTTTFRGDRCLSAVFVLRHRVQGDRPVSSAQTFRDVTTVVVSVIHILTCMSVTVDGVLDSMLDLLTILTQDS